MAVLIYIYAFFATVVMVNLLIAQARGTHRASSATYRASTCHPRRFHVAPRR